jgi:hypothetical protein
MEDIYPQHPTGYVCQVCDAIAVVDMDNGGYLCAVHGIEVIMRIDLRETEPVVTIEALHANALVGAGRPGTCLEWFNHHTRNR